MQFRGAGWLVSTYQPTQPIIQIVTCLYVVARDKDDRIGDIMKKLAPFLKLSTEYVKQFEAALTLVETWQKKSSSFAALLREIAVLSPSNVAPLAAFLEAE